VNNIIDSLEADRRRRAIKSYRKSVGLGKPVREFLGHRRAITITADDVREYVALRKTNVAEFRKPSADENAGTTQANG
jgi:hypothetical protein